MKTLMTIIGLALATTAGATTPKGVDRANLNPEIAPGENFYQYACGGWIKAHPLDPQYARFGTFDMLAENSREQVKDIITGLVGGTYTHGSNEQKIADLYSLGMDMERRNREGATPLHVEKLKAQDVSANALPELLAELHTGVSNVLFEPQVMADMKDSDVNLLYLAQAGLTLPDRDYYLDNDENSVKLRAELENYITTVMQLAGYKKKEAKRVARNVATVERTLAAASMTREQTRDLAAQYNIMTVEQVCARWHAINWARYFEAIGASSERRVCVCQPDFFDTVDHLVDTAKPEVLRDYIAFHIVNSYAPYLSEVFVNAHFDLFSRALSGKEVIQPLWKRSLDVPNTLLGEAVGQLYVAKYFPADAKRKMQILVDNLKVALGEHIATLDWMSPATKVNALVKLNSFTVKIGYPDRWRDYSALDIDLTMSYSEAVMAARRFAARYELSQLGKPVDKDRWYMTPQTVNAYYEPTSNEICFPAGILQPPYFDPEADDASNYGAIGVVIGHEMTHGFDDQGRNFDNMGNMTDWWTAEDAARFQALADKLGAQYSAEIVADDVHANGVYTMGENIADHGGLRVAFSALERTEQWKQQQAIDGFTPAQRFYISYANVWANNITKQEILRRTKVDPHSLGVNRVNVAIRNLDTFFEAFGITAGDAMWRDPEDRVAIW